jgi:hypothetical protein
MGVFIVSAQIPSTNMRSPPSFSPQVTGSSPAGATNGDGDDATSSCYLNLIDVMNHGATLVTGIYRDRLRKVDGAWKFVERNVSIDSAG